MKSRSFDIVRAAQFKTEFCVELVFQSNISSIPTLVNHFRNKKELEMNPLNTNELNMFTAILLLFCGFSNWMRA
jgi:hypothetical protein